MKRSDLKKYSVKQLDTLYASLINKEGVDSSLLSAIEKEIERKIDAGEEPQIKKSMTLDALREYQDVRVVPEKALHKYIDSLDDDNLKKGFDEVVNSTCINLQDVGDVFVT